MTVWNRSDGDERPMMNRSYWLALPSGPVVIGFYGAERADDVLVLPKRTWRHVADQLPVDPPPSHWAEIDVPAHPEAQR